MRMLEGEYFVYDGKLWFIKGYQHPYGMVIAYPRYSLLNYSRNVTYEQVYWDCIKQFTPMVNVNDIKPYTPRLTPSTEIIVKSVVETLGLRDDEYIVTGSSILGLDAKEVDLVIYSGDTGFIEEITGSINRFFGGTDVWGLIEEYYGKHIGEIDLLSYLTIKKNTPLHFMFMGRRVNLKIVRFIKGYNTCIDPVKRVEPFAGYVKVINAIYKRAVPALYEVLVSGEKLFMETYREMYCELPRGTYYVSGRIEFRNKGLFIVPDRGYLKFIDYG